MSNLTELDFVTDFVHHLREASLPVAMSENLDAIKAVGLIGLSDREALRQVLKSTLVKNYSYYPTFDVVFDIYFSLKVKRLSNDEEGNLNASGSYSEAMSYQELAEMLFEALINNDEEQIKALARMAVELYGGIEKGRAVAGNYYIYRTLSNIKFDLLFEKLLGYFKSDNANKDVFASKISQGILNDEIKRRLEKLKYEIETYIKQILTEDRGHDAMIKSIRKPLPEDIEIMHASREELKAISNAIGPLSRKLAAKLAKKHLHQSKGALDWKKTIRHSLSTGGTPIEVEFKKPHKSKPEIVVLADISGSVASFARFTLHLVYALSNQFSKIRSFVFIDGLDEVTKFFDQEKDISQALFRINTESKAILYDGHSDYGRVFKAFCDRYLEGLTNKTSVLILGDARSNYHSPNVEALKAIKKKVKHIFWLNPEPKSYWNTGDSILDEYKDFLDGTFEVRTLRQLEHFVAKL